MSGQVTESLRRTSISIDGMADASIDSHEGEPMSIRLISVKVHRLSPPAVQVILGQAHFIKTVEDLHEALVTAVPGIKFGLAFCEASEPC